MRAGAVWLLVAGFVYAWLWLRLGSASSVPADLGAMDTLRFHRRELGDPRAAELERVGQHVPREGGQELLVRRAPRDLLDADVYTGIRALSV